MQKWNLISIDSITSRFAKTDEMTTQRYSVIINEYQKTSLSNLYTMLSNGHNLCNIEIQTPKHPYKRKNGTSNGMKAYGIR